MPQRIFVVSKALNQKEIPPLGRRGRYKMRCVCKVTGKPAAFLRLLRQPGQRHSSLITAASEAKDHTAMAARGNRMAGGGIAPSGERLVGRAHEPATNGTPW